MPKAKRDEGPSTNIILGLALEYATQPEKQEWKLDREQIAAIINEHHYAVSAAPAPQSQPQVVEMPGEAPPVVVYPNTPQSQDARDLVDDIMGKFSRLGVGEHIPLSQWDELREEIVAEIECFVAARVAVSEQAYENMRADRDAWKVEARLSAPAEKTVPKAEILARVAFEAGQHYEADNYAMPFDAWYASYQKQPKAETGQDVKALASQIARLAVRHMVQKVDPSIKGGWNTFELGEFLEGAAALLASRPTDAALRHRLYAQAGEKAQGWSRWSSNEAYKTGYETGVDDTFAALASSPAPLGGTLTAEAFNAAADLAFNMEDAQKASHILCRTNVFAHNMAMGLRQLIEQHKQRPAPMGGEAKLREPVAWFACEMEKKLKENDHKGGWADCGDGYLLDRLKEEADELAAALLIDTDGSIILEAADVANLAMMLADKARIRRRASSASAKEKA